MSISCRATKSLLFVLAVSIPLFAAQQPATSASPSIASKSPLVVVSAAGARVRFTAPGATAAQIRVQIIGDDGGVLYDSSWKDGNVLDWGSVDSQGQQLLPPGSYRCVIDVKDLQGSVSGKEAVLVTRGQRATLEPSAGGASEGLAIIGPDGSTGPKLTLLAHDGKDGAVVSTSGDLSFRFGDFLRGTDDERMRLTSNGDLQLNGVLHANGIVFPDGTSWTTTGGSAEGPASRSNAQPSAQMRFPPGASPVPPLKPRSNVNPQAQFLVGDTGVTIGTSNANYSLNVTGPINTSTQYNLQGVAFAYANGNLGTNTFLGINSGTTTSGGGNTGLGTLALHSVTTTTVDGINNTAVGAQAGEPVTHGSCNAFVGAGTGNTATTESNNSGFGAFADITAGVTNTTAIGYRAQSAQSNTVILGSISGVNSSAATASTGIATQTPNQYLGVGGGITVDENNTNNGTLLPNGIIAFGTATSNAISGEAIGSQRTGTGNLFGLDLYTLYTKRISISNGGSVGIGTPPPTNALLAVNGTVSLNLASGGAINVCFDASNRLATCSSSIRYKENVVSFDGGLDVVRQLHPVTFRWKDGGKQDVGLIAEQVKDVEPLLTTTRADGEVEGVKYDHLTVVLINAVKELEEENRILRERVDKLERQAESQK